MWACREDHPGARSGIDPREGLLSVEELPVDVPIGRTISRRTPVGDRSGIASTATGRPVQPGRKYQRSATCVTERIDDQEGVDDYAAAVGSGE